MRFIVLSAVFVLMLVTYCNGACFWGLTSPLYCVYKFSIGEKTRRVFIEVGKTRRLRRKCLDCTCGLDGALGCCSSHPHFASIPDACMVKKSGCRERLVMKNNPRKRCVGGPISMVGR